MRIIFALLFALLPAHVLAQQSGAPPRDPSARVGKGTATISGHVTAATVVGRCDGPESVWMA